MGKTVKGALSNPGEMLMNPEESQKLAQPLKERGWPGKVESYPEIRKVKTHVPWLVSLLTILREKYF